MKIVLNKCFGGFGVSHEGKMEYYKRAGLTAFPYVDTSRFDKPSKFERYVGQKIGMMNTVLYLKNDPEVESFKASWKEVDEKYGYHSLDFEDLRTDEAFVSVVEDLGEKADGSFSNLEVYEIPDGAEYSIHDYDGVETLYYGSHLGQI